MKIVLFFYLFLIQSFLFGQGVSLKIDTALFEKKEFILNDNKTILLSIERESFCSIQYYPDGKISMLEFIINSKRNGPTLAYYNNGALKYLKFFVNDIQIGKFKYWYSSGVVEQEGEIGLKQGYDSPQMICETKVLQNNITVQDCYESTVSIGTWKKYNEKGDIIELKEYNSEGLLIKTQK